MNKSSKKLLKKILKIFLPLLLGLLMVWSLTRKVEWPIVLEEIEKGIAWEWVFVSIVFALLSHIVRGLRWRMQLRALGINPSAHDMAVSVFGNYGLNLALPRVGEVWRCSYIATRYGLPFSTTIGTMVSERLVDMIVAGVMLLMAILHEQEHFVSFLAGSDGGQKVIDLFTSPWLLGACIVAVVLVLLCSKFLKRTQFYQKVAGFIYNMWVGIKGIKDVPNLWGYLAWSLFLWFCYYVNSYTCCYFFGFTEHLDAWAGLAIFIMGSLSLVLPVQGGLGPWHYAVGTALLCYGIGQELSDAPVQTFIWVSWSLEQGFVLLLGLYAMVVVMLNRNK
ncbi:MAG: lysylphosphatidylglycerol synthase transmembrane domain-containing protein [Bacteroidales bacterium]|nr:lysylphosphatidylglycerol synthase transmembrane domain-containing protein [Bacteroidales bacterium]